MHRQNLLLSFLLSEYLFSSSSQSHHKDHIAGISSKIGKQSNRQLLLLLLLLLSALKIRSFFSIIIPPRSEYKFMLGSGRYTHFQDSNKMSILIPSMSFYLYPDSKYIIYFFLRRSQECIRNFQEASQAARAGLKSAVSGVIAAKVFADLMLAHGAFLGGCFLSSFVP